ncbi:hypothetical protein Tco_0098499 [Tanacetum coccineum]
METQNPLLKDEDGEKVDVHMYRSMIGSLMYLTSSRPNIMFVVCACARYQVNPKVSHLHAVKRIFSDYAGASLDRKSTTGGYQILGCRLISWQCKKQTVVANSTTEADSWLLQLYLILLGKANKSVRLMIGMLFGMELELMLLLDLEKTKTTQHNEIASLKRRVKKLEKKNRSRTYRLKRLYKVGLTTRVESSDNEESLGEDASKQGRIDVIDADKEITLVSVHDVNVSTGEEVFVTEQEVAKEVVRFINTTKLIIDATQDSATGDIVSAASAAKTVKMKSTKPKKKGVVIQELGESTTTISSQLSSQQSQDNAKFDEEERLVREKAKKEEEVNIALIETYDDIQVKINVDYQLAKRMQAQEQEELSIEEKATLFQQLFEKRRKHFAAKRVEEKRNKPQLKAQQRKIMCTYLKNMEGYKLKDLKLKEFDSIQDMFDKALKRQKVEDDNETAELKQLMEIIPDEEEVSIDAIPLAVKSPSIVGWKIYKEGTKSYYQIIRADGKSQMYMIFSQMLKRFDREYLEDLYKLVKAKYESTRSVEDLDLLLWCDLKTMFEPHVEDKVWKNQQEYKVLNWKLYDSCGVHSLMMQHVQIYMLVEKKYPLTPSTLSMM